MSFPTMSAKRKRPASDDPTRYKKARLTPPPLPPWIPDGIRLENYSLHREIADFCQFMSPTKAERLERQKLITLLNQVVKDFWPNSNVQVFGSVATNLYLPSSDIDCVVTGEIPPLPTALWALKRRIIQELEPLDIQVIAHAKVPLVKFTDITGIKVDISFHQKGGVENTQLILRLLLQYRALKPLVFVLKYFLQQRFLNEPYTGGLGSYALILMVVSYFQYRASEDDVTDDYGKLLSGFLLMFGHQFDYETTGISVRCSGRFAKEKRGWLNEERPFLVSIEDPNDDENDVGRPSFNILDIRRAFQNAGSRLADEQLEGTRLSRILFRDPSLSRSRS